MIKYTTEESLLEELPLTGGLVIHELARSGGLDQVREGLLSAKVLTEHSNWCEKTPIHIAAECGHLDQVPKGTLEKTIHEHCVDGLSVLQVAIEHGNVHQFPEVLLSRDNLLVSEEYFHGNNSLHWAAYKNQLLSIKRFDEADYFVPNWHGRNVIHMAAWSGNLKQIPGCLLTQENLFKKDKRGFSPIDLLAKSGFTALFRQIPRGLIPVNKLPRLSKRVEFQRGHLNGDCFVRKEDWAHQFWNEDPMEMTSILKDMPEGFQDEMFDAIIYLRGAQREIKELSNALEQVG